MLSGLSGDICAVGDVLG